MFPPRTSRAPVEEDDPFDFPDLPDSFSDQNQPSRTPSSSSAPPPSTSAPGQSRKGLQSTILGSGPNGVGVITKLNKKAKPNITHGSIKLKNKAIAKTWEDELDFEGDWGGTLKLRGNGKVVNKFEIEDGGEMDGFDDDDEEDWEGTLKSKLKGSGMGTIKLGDKGSGSKPGLGLGLPPRKPLPDADLDDLGFDLDEDIQVDKGKAKTPKKVIQPPSNRFFIRPTPNNLPGADALDDLDVFDDFNEDEATIKASAAMRALLPPPRLRAPPPPIVDSIKEDDIGMDDDFALPLNLTNLTLATRGAGHRPRTSIASTNTDWNSPTTSTSASNERWDSTPPSKRFSETSATSLSDGPNSFKVPTTPSSQARSQIPISTRRSPNGKPSMPPPSSIGRDSPNKRERERTQSSVGVGHRSHSTGNSAIHLHGSPSYMASQASASGSSGLPPPSGSGFKAFFSPTRPKSPLQSPGIKEKERSRSGQAFIPMRIPQTPERGLRHQKSSSHLPSPTHQGPSIIRKQSLSSLQDPQGPTFSSVSSLQSLAEEPSKPHATSSGSRLTNPTHASSSKVKTRLPLHGVFPGSSASRVSGLPLPSNSGFGSSTRSRLLHAQMKRRPYGDGSELEAIEDLVVEDEDKGSWGSSARSRGGSFFFFLAFLLSLGYPSLPVPFFCSAGS
jgi:hypothetical protein